MATDQNREALEAVLGDLPDNVKESERQHLDALTTYIAMGDAKAVNAIPEKALRLLRVKFSGWQGPRFKDMSKRYLPPEQLLGAMDQRLRQLDAKASRKEKIVMIIYGAAIGLTVSLLVQWALGILKPWWSEG